MYRHVDAALIRAAAYPGDLVLPERPQLSGDEEADTVLWRSWIAQVWQLSPVVEAVELASPALADRVHQICVGRALQPSRLRRIAVSLYRYVLRLQHRSTPFGLFAGIAPARIGTHVNWRWGEEHQPVLRLDAVWLSEVVGRLEKCLELLLRLTVVADSTGFVRDGRWVLPCRRPDHEEARGPGEVGVCHTRAVEIVLSAASSPVSVADLTAKLAAAYPDLPAATIAGLLTELVAHGVLITSLRPAMTVTDTLGHLIDQLDAAGASGISAVEPAVRTLRELRSAMARRTMAEPAARLRTEATVAMRAENRVVEAPLAIDLKLDCALTLPEHVAAEAEKAAGALARLTPFPSGSAAWQGFHARFLERYGSGALVPVGNLTDPNTGLDLPGGYRGSLLTVPTPVMTARDTWLLAVAQQAALDSAREVELTEDTLGGLEAGPGLPLPHIDLRFGLQAATGAAIEVGDFDLVVTGVSPAAGAAAGRFLDLLHATDRARMATAYAGLPTVERGAVRAQVSSPPLHVRTENVGRAPALLPLVIPIAEHQGHDGRALPLEDLAVTADANRMVLVQISTGQTVEPTVLNSVDLKQFTHPLARLLVELPRARCAAFGPFSWGAAAHLPFLPRIRYGRAVLAPATWRIEAADLPGPGARLAQWTRELSVRRQRLNLPQLVQLGEDDRRLRLDLDHSADITLLRTELDRTGHATLREAPDEAAYGWFAGRPHEITLALASTTAPIEPSAAQRARAMPVGPGHGHLPGTSTWAYLKLYGHPDRVPGILTRHLSRLWEGWDNLPLWWFVRYRDPRDHLRLRFRLAHPDAFADLATRVAAWAAGLRERGLIGPVQWDTYYPETGRYGSGAAMTAAEAFFAADSAAVLAQLAFTANSGALPQTVTTASLVDLATAATGDIETAMRWLVDHITTGTGGHPSRTVHREAIRLAHPVDGRGAIHNLPGGDQVTAAWDTRREALNAYRATLSPVGRIPMEAVLPSLLHMHHLRAAGIDQTHEHTCNRLARSTALAWTARHEGATT